MHMALSKTEVRFSLCPFIVNYVHFVLYFLCMLYYSFYLSQNRESAPDWTFYKQKSGSIFRSRFSVRYLITLNYSQLLYWYKLLYKLLYTPRSPFCRPPDTMPHIRKDNRLL